MRMYDLIEQKKRGSSLSREEIEYIVNGYTNGEIPDYQMSAFLMAVCFQGLSMEETVHLTMAMAHSGDLLDLSSIPGIPVDKHSTGGVGDKTTLIVAPMLASLGVPMAKMSGRGLGHTGGTIDKLESFTGFSTVLSQEAFLEQVRKIHMAIVSQTANLAPADKKIYALRDVTATVNQMSLIASSIMSKKLAAGAQVIVLDVKTGSGAFMETPEEARQLAQMMVSIGTMVGRETIAVISDMNEPLGHNVGNALEVAEAIEVLNGHGEERLTELSLTLASYLLLGAKRADTVEQARAMLMDTIGSGAALDKLAEFVTWQGGDAQQVYHPEQLPAAPYNKAVFAPRNGYLTACCNREVGMASLVLGGGRQTKESEIDLRVGLVLHKKLGDAVNTTEPLATIYGSDPVQMQEAEKRLLSAYTIADEPAALNPLIREVITQKDAKNE